jgi:hypothetical protein
VASTKSQVIEPVAPIHALSSGEPARAERRASLRDEAPRPLGFNARSDAILSHTAPLAATQPVASATYNDVGPAPQSIHSSNWGPQQSSSPSSARTAAWDDPSVAEHLTPIPIRAQVEEDQLRTHIIVDGDSLAKLAGRYLDDPHRADEIYQLNRDLLSDPELLPIGVELAIPGRSTRASDRNLLPQSSLPRSVAIHSPHGNGLIPVRPIPATSSLTPRARLVNPRQAE